MQIERNDQARIGEKRCIEVEWLRWWDDGAQTADIIHYFGRPPVSYVQFAQRKGMKVVVGELLTGLGSRSDRARWMQACAIRMLRRVSFLDRMDWKAYTEADACVALTAWEAHLMQSIFGAPAARVHVVPNGVEADFLMCRPSTAARGWSARRRLRSASGCSNSRGPQCTRQRHCGSWAAPTAMTIRIIAPFLELARAHPQMLRFEGPINDRAQLAGVYRAARGFVLLSTMESLSLSALEATACECPMLLSDLPWARTTFGNDASYCPATASVEATAAEVRAFL